MTHTKIISKRGQQELRRQLKALQKEYNAMRGQLAESRQVKDAEEFDLVDETIQLESLERQIAEINDILAHCSQGTTVSGDDSTVQLGSVVKLQPEGGEAMQCVVVSSVEADPGRGLISDQSPLGSALLGKVARALVRVRGPRRTFLYKILSIS